ncbi:MAG: cytochrome c oxidase assembly protein [Gaiellaceae bacterium]
MPRGRHNPTVGPVSLLGAASWNAAPAVLVPAGIAAALSTQAFVRLRRRGRGDRATWGRAALLAAGLAAAALALVSPLDHLAEADLLSAHMFQHVLIGDLAPALLLAAVRGPLLFFLLPAPLLGPVARARPVRHALRVLTRPRVAFALWATNLAVWHVPRLYDAALRHSLLHDFEHGCWFTTGLLVWMLLVDPAGHRRLTVGSRIALAVCLFAAGQILTDVLVFSFTPLYPAYTGAHGLSAVTDQQLAGVVMMVEQLLTLGLLTAVLLRPRLRAGRPEPAPA